ncbi:MAG TPA: class I SAM-dependent methyltransferase [Puia sp.]|nr:class I SAM-dependent methyltransferase [Puia sp.]
MKMITGQDLMQSTAYYNAIAAEYDAMLLEEPFNREIREKVASEFCSAVPGGWVLDFGGGTGLDLGWLSENHYHVIFCEPSEEMRKRAIDLSVKTIPAGRVRFLEAPDTDFTQWETCHTFSQKIDAALCNFAVLNCISDINNLFNRLSVIIKPGGYLFALVLRYDFWKNIRSRPAAYLRRMVFGGPISYMLNYKNHSQTIFLHSPRAIKKAAQAFHHLTLQSFTSYPFDLVRLEKK